MAIGLFLSLKVDSGSLNSFWKFSPSKFKNKDSYARLRRGDSQNDGERRLDIGQIIRKQLQAG